MIKRIIYTLFISLLSAGIAAAEVTTDNSEEFYQNWAAYYYINNDTVRAGEYIRSLQDHATIVRHKGAAAPIAAFLSILFAENPDRINGWLKGGDFTGETRDTIEEALWISGNANKIMEIFHDKKPYISESPVKIAQLEVKNPIYIDMMWGAFSASGSPEYVNKVIDVLDPKSPLSGDEAADKVTREAAGWSLKSNISQHERVERIVTAAITRQPEPVKKILGNMLAEVHKKRKHFVRHNGEFSAMLAVTAESVTPALPRYSDEEIQAHVLVKVKRGERIALNILFSGMALDDHLQADVSYDMKVVAPDSSIYDQLAFGNMTILKEKIPRRFGIFYNHNVVVITFDPKDKQGVYKISAVVKDNNSNKSVPLNAKVELVD